MAESLRICQAIMSAMLCCDLVSDSTLLGDFT